MGFWTDPLSSLWFNLLITVVPVVLFLIAMYALKKKIDTESDMVEERQHVTVH